MKAIIFDLDQTLIDSYSGKLYRTNGQWKKVYGMLGSFKPYPGVDKLITKINDSPHKISIVTSNPHEYCSKIINLWGWKIDEIVTREDVDNLKPNPEPFILAQKKLEIDPESIISIGDQAKDIIASRRAGIKAIAALWGAKDIELLLSTNPHIVCKSIQSLYIILTKLNIIK
jgi:HAD superfamily hydrolase (TIGR01549 family)